MATAKTDQDEEEDEMYLDPVSDGGGKDIDDRWFKITLKRCGNLIDEVDKICVKYPQNNMPDRNLDIYKDKRIIFRRGPNFPDVKSHRIVPVKQKNQIDVFLEKAQPKVKWKPLFDQMR